MNRRWVAACAAVVLSVCGVGYGAMGEGRDSAAPGQPQPATSPATRPAGKPVNSVCPIQGEAIDPGVTTVYQGKTIGFCCQDCIAEFNKDPEKYMKSLK